MLSAKTNIFSLIAAAVGISMPSFMQSALVAEPRSAYASGSRSRFRSTGPARPAGSKLARKAASGQLTKCHPGLSPKIAGRFPFSAKRRAA